MSIKYGPHGASGCRDLPNTTRKPRLGTGGSSPRGRGDEVLHGAPVTFGEYRLLLEHLHPEEGHSLHSASRERQKNLIYSKIRMQSKNNFHMRCRKLHKVKKRQG